jgi:hypothetical protein
MGEEYICICVVDGVEHWYDVTGPGECRSIEADLKARHGSVACRLEPW